MNKAAIKNYAIWARVALIKACTQKAFELGITAENSGNRSYLKSTQMLKSDGTPLSGGEQGQRDALLRQTAVKGFTQVMEEAAYAWFNRFIALKYMQEHGLLPLAVKALPGSDGQHPEMLSQALNIRLEGLNREKVLTLLERSDSNGLYKTLLITLCNGLSGSLPRMFETISDYTELLFPDGLLKPDSVLSALSTDIPEEDWQDIEIVGWLYQFYNTELKDETFALLKKNVKITKERIGAATQLFTPEWIVRYMVENSLGRLWLEAHPDSTLQAGWKYYLEEAEQEPEVRSQLAKIREEYGRLRPEGIKVIDPCMGSGHILVYAFDLLMQIYRSQGYTDRDAVESIVRNNLYGLDIDDRAAQLAYFAVMMKAAQYDKRFLLRGIQPNLCAIQESNGIEAFDKLHGQMKLSSSNILVAGELITQFRDAKTYGSLLSPRMQAIPEDFLQQLEKACVEDLETLEWYLMAQDILPALIRQGEILSRKYDVVVTNPPYMGSSGMVDKLAGFLKEEYPDSKSDLFAAFIEKGLNCVKRTGFTSMITMESWMFLSSFEKLRRSVINNATIIDMVHMPYLGKGGTSMGINFGTAATVLRKGRVLQYSATFDRISYYETDDEGVPFSFPVNNEYSKHTNQEDFKKIPGMPIAYWLSNTALNLFEKTPSFSTIAEPRAGLQTGENDTFLRVWHEIPHNRIKFCCNDAIEGMESKEKWYPYSKGGEYRKWYGNYDYVVNWENDGSEIKNFKDDKGKVRSRPQNTSYYFREGVTWSTLTSGAFSARLHIHGAIFDVKGSTSFFDNSQSMFYMMAFMNSIPFNTLMKVISPTLDYNAGYIGKMPVKIDDSNISNCCVLSKSCVSLAISDWDSFETSWDFKQHPLL